MSRQSNEIDRRDFLRSAAGVGALIAMPSLGACRVSSDAMPDEPTAFSASELSIAIRQRQVSCVEVMQAYLSRIERYNPVYNAIVSMLDEDQSGR